MNVKIQQNNKLIQDLKKLTLNKKNKSNINNRKKDILKGHKNDNQKIMLIGYPDPKQF